MSKPSGVIKASGVSKLANATIRAFRLNDVMDEAKEFVARANAEAENILREAELRARRTEQDVRQAADERGYREGYQRGLAEGRETGQRAAFKAAAERFQQQHASLMDCCRSMLSSINADREAWLTSARQDLVELAMAIARRVAHHVGHAHREVVLANLEEAVRLVGARSDVTIAVNPADDEAARSFASSLIDLREQWENIRVVSEPEIPPGGCRVQWGSGAIDATLETQLDRIEAALNAGLRRGEATRAEQDGTAALTAKTERQDLATLPADSDFNRPGVET